MSYCNFLIQGPNLLSELVIKCNCASSYSYAVDPYISTKEADWWTGPSRWLCSCCLLLHITCQIVSEDAERSKNGIFLIAIALKTDNKNMRGGHVGPTNLAKATAIRHMKYYIVCTLRGAVWATSVLIRIDYGRVVWQQSPRLRVLNSTCSMGTKRPFQPSEYVLLKNTTQRGFSSAAADASHVSEPARLPLPVESHDL